MANVQFTSINNEREGVPFRIEYPDSDNKSEGFVFQYLLVLRFAIINVMGAALVAAAWMEGLLDGVFVSEQGYLIAVIVGTFILGLLLAGQKLWQISQEMNSLRSGEFKSNSKAGMFLRASARTDGQGRSNLAAALNLKIATRIGIVRNISNSLVILGLIGTVIGFIIALSGVNPDAVSDVSAIGPMVSTLISGMSVALYTTLIGSVLNVWLNINYRILESGTVSFLSKLTEIGEYNAKS